MAYTFGAADILAALGITAADFEVQESGNDEQQDFAVTKSKEGHNVASSEVAFNKREEKTINIKSKTEEPATVSFHLGGEGTDGVVITQFSVKQNYNDLGSLDVTAHKHLDTEENATHLPGPVDQEVEVELGFGISAVRLGGTLKDCQSAELSGSVEHTDKYSNKGKFLTGSSHGLRFEATEEYVDSGSAISVPAPWKQDSQQTRTGNSDMVARTVRAHAFSLS